LSGSASRTAPLRNSPPRWKNEAVHPYNPATKGFAMNPIHAASADIAHCGCAVHTRWKLAAINGMSHPLIITETPCKP